MNKLKEISSIFSSFTPSLFPLSTFLSLVSTLHVSPRSNKYLRHKLLNGQVIINKYRGFSYEYYVSFRNVYTCTRLVTFSIQQTVCVRVDSGFTTGRKNKVESMTVVHRISNI